MKFSANRDLSLPITKAFAGVSDFGFYERQMLRRGVKIERLDDSSVVAEGVRWKSQMKIRGKAKNLLSEVTGFYPGEGFEITTDAGGITAFTTVDLTVLSATRTRLTVGLDLRPETLSGRLFIQSLKFAKGNLSTRFKKRIEVFAEELQARADDA